MNKKKIIGALLLLLVLSVSYSCRDESTLEVKANFQSKKKALVGEPIQFTDTSEGQPSSWLWVFEGGTPDQSTAQNPLIAYANSGIYMVSLSASNSDNSDTKVEDDYIEIFSKVTASFSANLTSINQGTPIEFNDSSEGNPTSWEWTFPGGNPSTSTEKNPIVTFLNAGNHSVKLVSSNEVSTSTFTSKILVLPTDGLLVHFPFNGNFNDLSENNNSGVNYGAEATVDRFNAPNKAFKFDGVNDKVSFKYVPELSNLPISISFWVNFEELKSTVLGTDINDYYQSGVWFSIGQSSETLGKLAINFGNGGTPPGPDNRKTFLTDTPLEIDKWYHVVGVVENIGTMKIYIDGEELSGSYSGSANSFYHFTNDGNIGRAWDPNTFFNGTIDDFRIYNRSISSSEVSLLFAEH